MASLNLKENVAGPPDTYGGFEGEYWAAREKAGIAIRSDLGLLTLVGRDRSTFLNGLLTNDIANLKEHQGIRACLLTPKARIQAELYVHNLGEKLLVETGNADPSKIKAVLDRFIITEDVQIQETKGKLTLLTVQGPKAAETINEAVRVDVSALQRLANQELGPSTIVNHDRIGKSGYDIILPAEESDAVWQGFLLKGVVPVGATALNILRLEACIPRYGVDIDENTLVLEAGMKDAISFSKGCYMGQETVARATFIGHVNKRLAQFIANSKVSLGPATKLYVENREAGSITSSDYSPALKNVVGLSYVQRDFAKEGTRVQVRTGQGPVDATITKLV